MKTSLSLAFLLFSFACGGTSPPGSAAPAPGQAAQPAGAPTSETHPMIATIDAFLTDPAAGDVKAILDFTRESDAVLVVFDQRLIPIDQAGLPEGVGTLLLAGFAAGDARAQLVSGNKADAPVDGVRGMLAVYRFLAARNPAVSIERLDRLIVREGAGQLEAAVAELLAPATGSAPGPTPGPSLVGAARSAYERLVQTDTFEDEAIGYAGSLSDNVADFRVLLADGNAGEAFAHLAVKGGAAGKLYALAGLWHTDRAAFAALARTMATSKERVKTQFGCLGGVEPVATIVDAGATSIRVRDGETVTAALTKMGGSGMMDMVGGSYPITFAGQRKP
jgi:hypothetical protein